MTLLAVFAGLVLVLVAFGDALWTTLWPDGGAGPLTARLSTGLWRATLAVAGTKNHRLLSMAGPFILLATVFTWLLLVAAGWTLVFVAEPGALLDVRTYEPADFVGRVWFVLHSVFTLGNGDYIPDGGAYQLAGAGTVASGMFLVTLAITYLLSVISAVVTKRSFASHVSSFGDTPEEFVITAWDGAGFGALAPQLATLTATLGQISEQHQAYPILHYYHATSKEKASPPAVAVFDEALALLEYAVLEECRPRPAELRPARQTVSSHLGTLAFAYIRPADRVPPPPDLGRLRDAGVPVVDDEHFTAALDEHVHRRRMLLGLVENDGWKDHNLSD